MDNIQGRYSHCGQTWNEGSIRHTPSLIIITHHTSHSLNVCVRMCVCVYRPLDHCSFQENRQSLDLSLSSLLTWPLCDVRVQVCDHSSSRRNQSFSGNTLLRCINHQPLRILTCSQAHFLVEKQQIFLGRKCRPKKRMTHGPIWGWMTGRAWCPFCQRWSATQSYLHQEWARCEQHIWFWWWQKHPMI